jgi:hypothetical protein
MMKMNCPLRCQLAPFQTAGARRRETDRAGETAPQLLDAVAEKSLELSRSFF